jgi:hypothetical protein
MSVQPQHHASENPSVHDHNDHKTLSEQNAADYWQANLRLLAKLLMVWFAVSFGCAILLACPAGCHLCICCAYIYLRLANTGN